MKRWEAFTYGELKELQAAVESRLQAAKDFVDENDMSLVTLACLVEELQEACKQAKYKGFPRIVGGVLDEDLSF